MTKVTIPTASYVGRESKYSSTQDKFVSENQLLPELLPAAADFNQQYKLWRFYCTCLDLGSSNYKLEDFHNKNMSIKDKYLYWVKNWKLHYNDISNLIRHYKKSRSMLWFNAPEQEAYRVKLTFHIQIKYPKHWQRYSLLAFHMKIVNERFDCLKKSAQHLLNARFIGKLASGALRSGNNNNNNNEIIA